MIGDEKHNEFGHLFETQRDSICTLFLRYGCNRPLAEDLTQETALRSFISILTGREVRKGLIYTIAKHVYIDHKRYINAKKRTQLQLEEPLNDSTEDYIIDATHNGVDLQIREELSRNILRALKNLPKASYEALIFYFFKEWTYEHIGRRYHITTNAATKRVYRAIDQLKRNRSLASILE